MSIDDLSSIQGLEDKHVQALAKQLHITTFSALASAESGAIHRAMSRFRPRPGPEEVASWQDQARHKVGTVVMDPSDWHPAASFAVVFSQRQARGGWERRIETERTEVEPELPPFVRPGWDCRAVCDWMHEQLPRYDLEEEAQAAHKTDKEQAASPGEPDAAAAAHKTRANLRIESAALIDATGRADLIQMGELIANPPSELILPARVSLTVTGAQPGDRVLAIARIRARGESEWSSVDPATADRSGRAELSMSPVKAAGGLHDIKLLAWAPDASTHMVSLRLPAMTIKPHSGC